MKKRLITSLILTLVIVLSMSTATFAWYTANAKATATVGTITAASATGDISVTIKTVNGAAAVAAEGASLKGYTTAAKLDKTISPTAPAAELLNYTGAISGSWVTGKLDKEGAYTGEAAASNANIYYGEIEVSNSSEAAANVKVSATKTQEKLNVIVFSGNTVLYSTGYAYGNYKTEGEATAVDAVAAGTNTISVANAASVTVGFIAWFDGYAMENADMGLTDEIEFTFEEVQA